MNLGIKNKRVLISGASNGIGKELAYQFANEGCKVTLLARSKIKLQNIINDIGGKKRGHHFFSVNLLPNGNATKISKKILKNIGVHDIIVHCVGGGLGVVEPGIIGILMLSLDRPDSVSIALMDRSISYGSIVLLGGILFAFVQIKRSVLARKSLNIIKGTDP